MTEEDTHSEYKDMKPGPISRTRLGIGIAALVFLAIVLLGELTPLGELIPSNGITRTDVAKYRIHILAGPVLDKLKNQLSSLNVTVALRQLGNSNAFRGDGGFGHFAYFKLTDKFDFEEIKPDKQGEILVNGLRAWPFYSFDTKEGQLVVSKNDVEFKKLPFKNVMPKNAGAQQQDDIRLNLNDCKPLIINYEKSAVFYTNKKPLTCLYMENLEQPSLNFVKEFMNSTLHSIESVAADQYGAQFFFLAKETPDSTECKLTGINFDKKPPRVVTFPTTVAAKTSLYHCAPARALSLLDGEKLRVIDASSGNSIAVLYFKDLFKPDKKNKNSPAPNAIPKFSIVPGVPAAIFGDQLIDLRSGEVVDTLYDFGPDSVYTVDYVWKRLYYSTQDQGGKKMPNYMSINVYDLHEVVHLFQVTLGTRSLVEDADLVRHDSIKKIFITQFGQVAALSAPANN